MRNNGSNNVCMVATMFAGCGSKESSDNATTPDTSKADTSSEVTAPAEDTGKVLNIYCWNEEFKSRITAHYPDYQEVDATHGKIGDVDVVWNITPNDDNAYQNNLDATLLNQADAPADDKIDVANLMGCRRIDMLHCRKSIHLAVLTI